MRPTQRYWDSNAFLGWLNREQTFSACDAIINDAKAGRCRIVTSTVTYAEVFWIRGGLPKAEQVKAIEELLGYSWIIPAELDKPTALLARELLQLFSMNDGLKPPDSIHLATAIRARSLGGVQCFDTWDGTLKNLARELHRVESLKKKDSGADLTIGPSPSRETLFDRLDLADEGSAERSSGSSV